MGAPHLNVSVECLDLSGELHTLLLQLLTFLHIAGDLELFSTNLIYAAPEGLDLLLLVLDQFPLQLDLTAGYTEGSSHGNTVINRVIFRTDFTSIRVRDMKHFGKSCGVTCYI